MTKDQLKAAADYLRDYRSAQIADREVYKGYASRQRRFDHAIAELGELADALEGLASAGEPSADCTAANSWCSEDCQLNGCKKVRSATELRGPLCTMSAEVYGIECRDPLCPVHGAEPVNRNQAGAASSGAA